MSANTEMQRAILEFIQVSFTFDEHFFVVLGFLHTIQLHNCISEICNSYNNVVITGDFNHRSINWETLHSQKEGKVSSNSHWTIF